MAQGQWGPAPIQQTTPMPVGMFRAMRQSELAEGQRLQREAHGRRLTFLRHHGVVVCMDRMCSHMGGPLGESGEIEELGGVTCIRCPLHGYRFDLGSGRKVSTDLEGGLCASASVEQRIHPTFDGGDGYIWVHFQTSVRGTAVGSDMYNCIPQPGFGLQGPEHSTHSTGSRGHSSFGLADTAPTAAASDSPQQPSRARSNSPVQPLTPFAGVEKRALAPSPTKDYHRITQTFQIHKHAAVHRPGARNGAARNAVNKNMYEPPVKPIAAPVTRAAVPAQTRMVQSNLIDLFGRQQQQQQQQPQPQLAMDMEF